MTEKEKAAPKLKHFMIAAFIVVVVLAIVAFENYQMGYAAGALHAVPNIAAAYCQGWIDQTSLALRSSPDGCVCFTPEILANQQAICGVNP